MCGCGLRSRRVAELSSLARPAAAATVSEMALPSIYLVEEALSLPAEQRRKLADVLLDSLRDDGANDDEVRAMLKARLTDLKSGKDQGMSFEDVFGEEP